MQKEREEKICSRKKQYGDVGGSSGVGGVGGGGGDDDHLSSTTTPSVRSGLDVTTPRKL